MEQERYEEMERDLDFRIEELEQELTRTRKVIKDQSAFVEETFQKLQATEERCTKLSKDN